jgi:hypothetical protein
VALFALAQPALIELTVAVESGLERRETELFGGAPERRAPQVAKVARDPSALVVGRQLQGAGEKALEVELPLLDPVGQLVESRTGRGARLDGGARLPPCPGRRRAVAPRRERLRFLRWARPLWDQCSDLLEST